MAFPIVNALSRFSHYVYWTPVVVFLGTSFYQVKTISGRSMQPTLNPNTSLSRDLGLFNVVSISTFNPLKRGDIVTLRSPEMPSRILIKRIIAVEGDVATSFAAPGLPTRTYKIPVGHVWVEGDEYFRSDDSNRYGPIPIGLIQSRLTFILWPFHRIGASTKDTQDARRGGRIQFSADT